MRAVWTDFLLPGLCVIDYLIWPSTTDIIKSNATTIPNPKLTTAFPQAIHSHALSQIGRFAMASP
jgi:hypothetical protein